MKLNKRLAASALALMLSLVSTNLPVIAAENVVSDEANIEESDNNENTVQEEFVGLESNTVEDEVVDNTELSENM